MAYRSGNFNFVIDSSFQPFTMQEMLAPLALYKEAFEKSEDAYADLKTKADVFKDLSESLPENSKARQIYEGYANDLNAQAEDLAKNGLNMGNRRALTSLKQRYSGEIGRLDRAKAALEEAKKTRNALDASGKRRLYATNNLSIDDFLDGNTPNMYSIDPDVLYAKGAQRGKSVSSRMTDIKESGNMIDGYFRNVIQSVGMNPQMLSRWMQSEDFSKMVDLAMIEEGVADNLTGMDYLKAKQAYISGIFDGVVYTEKNDLQRNLGKPSWSEVDASKRGWAGLANEAEKTEFERTISGFVRDANGNIVYDKSKNLKAQAAYDEALARATGAGKAAATAGIEGAGGVVGNPKNIYSQKERSKIDSNIEKFSKYFYKGTDGGVRMTKAGLEAYKNPVTVTIGNAAGAPITAQRESEFKQFIDSLGGADNAKNKRVGLLGNMWDKYVKTHSSNGYDAKQRTEFADPIDSSQQEEMKQSILEATGGRDLREIDFDEKSGKFVPKGKSLSMKDLNSDKYVVTSTRFSRYGNSVFIKDKEGKTKRYELPYGINPVNEANRDTRLAYMEQLQKALLTGVFRDNNGNERKLTDAELAQLDAEYRIAVQDAYMFHSQIGLRNKVKEQEFNPYSY